MQDLFNFVTTKDISRCFCLPHEVVKQVQPLDMVQSSLLSTTFVTKKFDGTQIADWPLTPCGGHQFASASSSNPSSSGSSRFLAERQFVLKAYTAALAHDPCSFKQGDKWDYQQLAFALIAAAHSVHRKAWPAHAVILPLPSCIHQSFVFKMFHPDLPRTWLVPVFSPAHWALLVVRSPASGRSWETTLVDSRAPREIIHDCAKTAAANLAQAFDLPQEVLQIKEFTAPLQDNDWECGPRVAFHAAQILKLEFSDHAAAGTFAKPPDFLSSVERAYSETRLAYGCGPVS
jgi:hypothetical protein